MIVISGKTIQGRRDIQQDNMCYMVKKRASMATVCDGMGGLADGDWASHIAIQLVRKHFKKLTDYSDIPSFYRNEIKHLDEVICRLVNDKNENIISGTTFSSAIIVENRLYFGSVGDSRIYWYQKRSNSVKCLTRDHNYKLRLDEELSSGKITHTQYQSELPKGASLMSYLGVGHMEYQDVNDNPIILENGDYVVLCTDGVYHSIEEDEFINALFSNNTPEKATNAIMEIVNGKKYRNQDNAGVVIVKYE